MSVPRIGLWLLCFLLPLGSPLLAFGQEGVFLKEEDAPRAVFPDANSFERRVIPASEELKQKIQQRMGKTKTSLWEDSYVTFVAKKGEAILGYAVIVEEIGKHEAYGGEVRDRRFLQQYKGKELKDTLLSYRDIQNISGATLSVEAIGRGSKKALALVDAVYLEGTERK